MLRTIVIVIVLWLKGFWMALSVLVLLIMFNCGKNPETSKLQQIEIDPLCFNHNGRKVISYECEE